MHRKKSSVARGLLVLLWVLLCGNESRVCAQSGEEDHKLSIRGIQIGMKAQDVLNRLGRMPDARRDEKEDIILGWKLEEGDFLQIIFRKEHVLDLRLQFKKPRPTTDFWLVPLASPASSTALTATDPRLRRDYKATETNDKLRTVWTRQEETPAGYHVEIRFLSGSRKQFGDRFGEFIEFKYVTVPKEDLKKFDQAFPAAKAP